MPHRILFTAFALLCATATARAQKDGAAIDVETGTVFVVAAPVQVSTTFVEFHSARVEHDLMLFKPTLVGIAPIGRSHNVELFSTAPAKRTFGFLAPAESGDALEVRRDRDRLGLFRGPQSQGASVAIGLAMFIAATVSSAHAPRSVRVAFDGPVHLGPAIFDGGGMGAGIAGRL